MGVSARPTIQATAEGDGAEKFRSWALKLLLGPESQPHYCQLCGLGQVARSLRYSVSSSIKWEQCLAPDGNTVGMQVHGQQRGLHSPGPGRTLMGGGRGRAGWGGRADGRLGPREEVCVCVCARTVCAVYSVLCPGGHGQGLQRMFEQGTFCFIFVVSYSDKIHIP